MDIRCITVGMFQVNTYLVTDPVTKVSAIIDTGETDELVKRLKAMRPAPQIKAILLTHAHIDHAGALPTLQAAFDAPTYLPAAERPLFETLPEQGTWFNAPSLNRPCGRIDRELQDGDVIQVGELELRFLSTPGHTPGHGCFYTDTDIFVGDLLFASSIGRTDFPLSSPQQMTTSLRRLFELPHHLRVHSGHGPSTTLAEELPTNPFLGFLRSERGL